MLEGADAIWVPLCEHSSLAPGLKIEDWVSNIRLFSSGCFSSAIEIPVRLRKSAEDVGPFAAERAVEEVSRDDIGFAAFKGSRDAEKADDVGVIEVGADFSDACQRHVSFEEGVSSYAQLFVLIAGKA